MKCFRQRQYFTISFHITARFVNIKISKIKLCANINKALILYANNVILQNRKICYKIAIAFKRF